MTGHQPPTPAIHCHLLTKHFGDTVALDDFELEIGRGEILSLLGPSGCGKTTALRVIAGFENPESGTVTIADATVVGEGVMLAPDKRRVGMVFQDYALFPHMTVAANIAYGLSGPGRHERVADVIAMVGLTGMGDRMPHELSGGEQQRVALARALAPGPAVILLDEPFSNLDATMRDHMRREVRSILKDAGATAVFVTHDREEALAIADLVAVMRDGKVVQVGTPQTLYRSPEDPWVAAFIGEAEFVAGIADIGSVETPLGTFPQFGSLRGPVQVLVRPEWVHLSKDPGATATVVEAEFYGHDQLVTVAFADETHLQARVGPSPLFIPDDKVDVAIDEVVVFPSDAPAPDDS
jgi:iron(III) transport system ATP-binding protein